MLPDGEVGVHSVCHDNFHYPLRASTFTHLRLESILADKMTHLCLR